MSPEKWERVKALFHLVEEASTAERDRILEDGCKGDDDVRREVLRLQLAAAPSDFLEDRSDLRLAVGARLLDRFEIVRLLGSGGMGEVYEARDWRLGSRHIALKTIRPDLARDSRFVQRLTKEVVLAREVVHPNVCPIYDLFEAEEQGRPLRFLTMRLIRGETLDALLRRRGPLSAVEALPLARQVCAGIDAAHKAGVIHGDLKPSNVIVADNDGVESATLTDFGLARTFEEGASAGHSSLVLATPAYAAPEVLNRTPVTTAADLFSLGVILYRMRMGGLPGLGAAMPAELGWRRAITACLDQRAENRPARASAAIQTIEGTGRRPPSKWLWAAAPVALLAAGWLLPGRAAVSRWLSPVPKTRHAAVLPFDTPSRP